ncbi:hypothetical protein D9M68_919780 [compost metagenome]
MPLASCTWLTLKITFIESGSAMEKPMNEPNVTMYRMVSDHVCLLLKIANCFATLSFIAPKAVIFITIKVLTMINGMASHMLSTPKPLGAGR